jgi:selenoprotein W-related protein
VARLLAGWGPVIRRLEVVPGTGGIFDVDVDGEQVFTKSMLGRYPQPDEVVPLIEARLGPAVLDGG